MYKQYKIPQLQSCLISISGGQDSINLLIWWINSNREKKSHSVLWCNHIWKISDFYLLRYTLQTSFYFHQRFFYTIFLGKYFSEQQSRKYRYFSFFRLLDYSHTKSVLTAHTVNDSLETFFLNLFRGSGKSGLQILRDFQIFFHYDCSQKFN